MLYSPWLYPEEHATVVKRLLELGLIKFSNDRDLPLKNGGYTDIYVNLRNARNNPEAITFLARLFAAPLNRLGPDRFIEIPDSVSCFAGPLSITTGIPYLTIREQAKEGRATDAKVIGQPQPGEKVCIIDDVITDGASKIIPHQMCAALKLDNKALVVLVDRQQGWQKNLSAKNIQMDVWAGLTLHDIRRQLIEQGLMQRCNQELERDNPIIVALDGKSWEQILPIIDQLRSTGCILKVNDLLFNEGIERLLPNLAVYGRVMVDLKAHDIPNTVANTCRRLKPYAPWAVTVHASGGEAMLQAAVKELENTATKVLAVTVLTSLDKNSCEEIYHRLPKTQVMKLADLAARAGVDGFVCSPEEAAMLRRAFPDLELVVPGVRSPGVDQNDQKRSSTPKWAVANGAKKIVMGRQLLDAPNIVAEVLRVLAEELGIF
jgi:orotidine-5'-phosphate decarboxylase